MTVLISKLEETLNHYLSWPETVQHVGLKYDALLRLQTWESSALATDPGVASPHRRRSLRGESFASPSHRRSLGGEAPTIAEPSMLEIAAQLEETLVQEGVVKSESMVMVNLLSKVENHSSRTHRVNVQISDLIDQAAMLLDVLASFDATKDPLIDAKQFDVILSRQMDALIGLVGSDRRMQVDALKAKVLSIAQHNLDELQATLRDARQNKHANQVLQRYKYIEPLTSLPAFSSLPGPTVFDAHLKTHCDRLTTLACSAVDAYSMSGFGGKVDATVVRPMIVLAKFGSEVARASGFVHSGMAEVLHMAEAKFGVLGMQSLASELRRLEPALGNEIISSSDAFQTLVIAEFNAKTKRDISVVKKLFAEKNKDIEDGPVWRRYEEFKVQYDRYLQKSISELNDMDILGWLVSEAKAQVGVDSARHSDTSSQSLHIGGNKAQQQVPVVLATIFAWWTMDFYLRLRKRNGNVSIDSAKLRQANTCQVVCLLRLLGATDSNTFELANHLAEVPTGEGKSVILAVLATTVALYGYNVSCVCYSNMLSSRDHADFAAMFASFGVLDKVTCVQTCTWTCEETCVKTCV